MDAYLTLLLRSQRFLINHGIRIDLVMEIVATNPTTGQPKAFRTVMDEREGGVEYDIKDGRARVGDVFFCGQKKDGRLVAYRLVPDLEEMPVEQPPKIEEPKAAPGIDVDAPPCDKPATKTL